MMKIVSFALLLSVATVAFAKDVDVLCIYYPEWHVYPEGEAIFGKGHTEWDYVDSAIPRFKGHEQPVRLVDGHPNDADPKDVAKEIDYAADAGIDCFVYDWYWADGHPIQHEALEQGFLKAPNRGRMKFALMWANHDRSDAFRPAVGKSGAKMWWKLKWTGEEFLEVIDYSIAHYFNSPDHYRTKDGKLFFSVYSAKRLIDECGGPAKFKAFLDEAQRRVQAAGLPAVHFSAMVRGPWEVEAVTKAGYDSTSSYNMTPYNFDENKVANVPTEGRQVFTHEEYARLHVPFNENIRTNSTLPHIPVAVRGWDPSARCRLDEPFPWKALSYPYLGIITDMKPALFGKCVADLYRMAAGDPKKPGMMLVNAWNEYTEGSYLMPDKANGDAYLKALKASVASETRLAFDSVGTVAVTCEKPGSWTLTARRVAVAPGVEELAIEIVSPTNAIPPELKVRWQMPQVEAPYEWGPDGAVGVAADWRRPSVSSVASSLPVYSFYSAAGRNRYAFACSDALNAVTYRLGLNEETCALKGGFTFFAKAEAARTRWTARIRIDSRDVFWADAVREASDWIVASAGLKPCAVPADAYEPLYSTWYNFHQDVHAADLEAECARAAKLGMKVIIVDDGWQTDDTNRGYQYCGDWQVSPRRFPDMRAHVAAVHKLGMKYMLWYSVPFVGYYAKVRDRFAGKYLREPDVRTTGILDPRFPEVRDYLTGLYEKAVRDWDIDGFKLDFIDIMVNCGEVPAAQPGDGRDCVGVPEGVDRLLAEIRTRLDAVKPGLLFEFRQSYVGPYIRQYGNMLRVGDCPGNPLANRCGIANLRLTSGTTAVHADMLEWHPEDTPESAARSILNVLFGTIQYSMTLARLPEAHRRTMVRWMAFAADHRESLLKGTFRPYRPEAKYPVLEGESAAERVIVCYDADAVVDARAADRPVFLVNAAAKGTLAVRLAAVPKAVRAFDLYGAEVPVAAPRAAGLVELSVPVSGHIEIHW